MNYEKLCQDCKRRFRGAQTGCCTHCGTLIKLNMTRHVATFHLDLAQLWRCPVSWCTQWKGMPQDCIDHLRQKHSAPTSNRMSPASLQMCYYSVSTVTPLCITTRYLAGEWCTPPCAGHLGPNSGHSLIGLMPKLSGRMVVAIYERLLYQRLRILCTALDPRIRR